MGSLGRWINQSLRRRIAVVVSGLALLLGAGVLGVSSFEVLGVSRQLYSERLRQIGEQLAPVLGRVPVEVQARLERAAADSPVVRFARSGGRRGVPAAAARLELATPEPRTALALTSPAGEPWLFLERDTVPDWFGPPPGADSLRGIGPHYRLDDSTTYYDIRVPIRDRGSVTGYLVRRIRSAPGTTRSALQSLMGEGMSLVIGSPATGVWNDLGTLVEPPPQALQSDQEAGFVEWSNKEYLASARSIPGTPWRLVIRVAEPVVTAPVAGYFQRAGPIAVLVVLVGVIAGIGLGRTLSRPIREIAEVAEQFATAEAPRQVPENSPGEVGQLARAFNAMVERVASSTRRLRENEASHRAFVSHASDGIWRVEFVPPASTTLLPQIQIESWYRLAPRVEANPALVRMTGREPEGESGSIPLAEMFPPDDPTVRRMWFEFVANGYRAAGIELVTGPDDSRRIFVNDLVGVADDSGLRRIWGTRRDVTLSRLVDERLAQTDRMEAIGRLAGGVAHDFNNLLTAIVGYSEGLQEAFPAGHPHHKDAAEINRIALRAGDLTKQLLAFSRGQVMRPSLIDLNSVVRSSEGLLRRVLSEGTELRLVLDDSIDAVEVDPGQLERVMMNLIVNARDAMPEGGLIEIATRAVRFDQDHVRTRPGMVAGDYVGLSVRDTGVGMSPEVRQHIFEPFYTTKPKGKGTGLGLSTVYGIVRQSGGDIAVESEPGAGTTVTLFLPVKGKIALPPSDGGPLGSDARGIIALTGNESILVVEDEAPVREVVRRALTAAGYTVRVAGEAAQALQIEAEGPSIDLLLTDMILPGPNGTELAAELRRRRPGLRVLVMSGFTGANSPRREDLPAGAGYLAKPFSLGDLRRKVREVLDGEQ